jgi:hypothetical protein
VRKRPVGKENEARIVRASFSSLIFVETASKKVNTDCDSARVSSTRRLLPKFSMLLMKIDMPDRPICDFCHYYLEQHSEVLHTFAGNAHYSLVAAANQEADTSNRLLTRLASK